MADLSRPAQDCVAAQGNLFDREKAVARQMRADLGMPEAEVLR